MRAMMLLLAMLAQAGPPDRITDLASRETFLRDRLATSDLKVGHTDELLRLIGRWAADPRLDREARARYALYRLQTIRKAAEAFEAGDASRSRFALLLGEQSPMLFYNEVGGGWMLRNEYILKVHDEFRGTRAADDIAWFAAENGVGGECEGYVPCYVSRVNMLYGEYLRRHPAGRHATEAIRILSDILGVGDRLPDLTEMATSKAEACRDLKKPLAELTAAVRGATGPTKQLLARLVELAAACR